MNRIFHFIIAALLTATCASAQLVGSTPHKSGNIKYPIEDYVASVPGGINTAIHSNYVSDALVSRFVMDYDTNGSDYVIESIYVVVNKIKKASNSLVGTVPMKEETTTHRVRFFPTDSEMKHFRASLDIGENGWDLIEITYAPVGPVKMTKAEYQKQNHKK